MEIKYFRRRGDIIRLVKAIGFWLAAALFVCVMALAMITLSSTDARASGGHDDCHHDCGGTSNTTFIKKNAIPPAVGGALLAAGIGGAVCIVKRISGDPCIDFSKEWKQTSREDDYVTPPSIDVNTRR